MLSLKLKNYALLSKDGSLTVKGSSLRSRRDEPYLREFLQTTIRALLEPGRWSSPRDVYLNAARLIIEGGLSPDQIARQETITERTFSSDANRRLARIATSARIGDRIAVYQREKGDLELLENFSQDEDRAYLLQRLRAVAERFRPLYEDDAMFDHDFPSITPVSDLDAVAKREPVQQQKLF